jgi:NAD(P)-dependent dehydrogenase (short-subunit alcohol dehydrogenase family)
MRDASSTSAPVRERHAPFATPYFASKAGLIRVTGCLQLEQEMDSINGVSFYCLHPGGVRTHSHTDPSISSSGGGANSDAYAEDVRGKYPEVVSQYQEFQKRFIDSGYLCGQTCAFIALLREKHCH